MLISIITPTFNSCSSIEKTVNSVIMQSFGDFEHIIIDNLSKDNTLELIRNIYKNADLEEKLKVISERDCGISDAFNRGITNSSGEIIGILNSDDIFYDETVLSKITSALSEPGKLIAHGNIYFEDHIYGSNIRFPLKDRVLGVGFNHPGMFIRKEVYKRTGLYDTNMHFAMDIDFFFRLQKEYLDIEQFSSYIDYPLVTMKAGGVSWKNEGKALKEVKNSLKRNNMWDINSKLYYLKRISRVRIKSLLSLIGLHRIVSIWRNRKWQRS